jgi:MFS transporter, ACS family, glucarate transporter
LKKRHSVLGLLLALAVVTFLDRIAISVAGPRIQSELDISPERWGWIIGAFVLSYGIFEMPGGALGDRIGPRKVLTRIVAWWSAFTMLTGAATGFGTLLVTRFLFGMGEAGAYPNIAAVVARWFPVVERARTQGYVWAASRLGGALAPLLVVPMQANFGWRTTFVILGVVGLCWAAVWFRWFHDDPARQPGIRDNELSELPLLAAGRVHTAVPWGRLFRSRQMWLIFGMYFCYAWCSWFYFGWFPIYLTKGAGFTEAEMGIFSALPFMLGAAGNVIGGWWSDAMTRRFGVKIGRRIVGSSSLATAACLLMAMTMIHDKTALVVVSSLGFGISDLMLPAAWALCLDVGRRHAGAVTGFMNTAGQFGGFVCSVLYGYVLTATGSYNAPVLIIAGVVFLAAILFSRIDPTVPVLPDEPEQSLEAVVGTRRGDV